MHPERLVPVVATLLAALVLLSPFALAGLPAIIESGLLKDDAFFYAVIAGNILAGQGPTFDGLHETNGFQPLWMLVLLALKTALPAADAIALQLGAGLALVAIGFGLLAWWLLRTPDLAALISALLMLGLTLFNQNFVMALLNGLETALLFALLPVWLILAGRALRRDGEIGTAVFFSMAGCAIFLTRTDMFWIVPATTLVLLRSFGLSRALAVNIGLSAAMVLPYLAWNVVRFGAVVPISGRVKRYYLDVHHPTWGSYLGSDAWQGLPSLVTEVWDVPMAATVVVVLLPLGAMLSAKVRRALPAELCVFAAVVALHLAYLHLAHRELRAYTNYYFVPELVFAMLFLASAARALLNRVLPAGVRDAPARPLPVWLLSAAAVAASFAVSVADLAPRSYWQDRLAIARYADAHLPEGERVGAFWPGLFAHVMARPVVPLDGIASSPAYFEEVVKAERELSYAHDLGIRHLIAWVPAGFAPDAATAGGRDWSTDYLARLADSPGFRIETVHAEGEWVLLALRREAG